MLYAFDLIGHDGEDLRNLPLIDRKRRLASCSASKRRAIRFVEYLTGNGPTVFRHVCRMGVEGYRLEADGRAVSQRAVEDMAQIEEPGERGGAPGTRGGVALALMRALNRHSAKAH